MKISRALREQADALGGFVMPSGRKLFLSHQPKENLGFKIAFRRRSRVLRLKSIYKKRERHL